jgi:hypothetical protein
MPKKRQTPAPKGVPWDPDIYDITEFVHGIDDLRKSPESPMVPLVVTERLAGLARIRDKEIFQAGIAFSVRSAKRDFPLLSSPVYHTELVERIKKVEEAASFLRDELRAIENPTDRTTLWAARAIGAELNSKSEATATEESKELRRRLNPFASHLDEVLTLIEATGGAKTSWPYVGFAQKKGAPAGTGESGMALTRFVAHLAFAALAAEGHWTLNKNDERGTLIEAMEALRGSLPDRFLPLRGRHPFSTYQKILTRRAIRMEFGSFPMAESGPEMMMR